MVDYEHKPQWFRLAMLDQARQKEFMAWICPHCGTTATLQSSDVAKGSDFAIPRTAADHEAICINWSTVKCPSKECGKFVVDATFNYGQVRSYANGERTGKADVDRTRQVGIGKVRIEPRVGSPLSKHVPEAVKSDYEEAYLIKDLSPKAAATLCRRALQGIVRNYWGISKSRLADELAAIKDQCDEDLYAAMMGLKAVGNIGAHPERDINVIVEVEEGEVGALLELIRILDKEWYVARAVRKTSLAAVVALGADKQALQLAAKNAAVGGIKNVG